MNLKISQVLFLALITDFNRQCMLFTVLHVQLRSHKTTFFLPLFFFPTGCVSLLIYVPLKTRKHKYTVERIKPVVIINISWSGEEIAEDSNREQLTCT